MKVVSFFEVFQVSRDHATVHKKLNTTGDEPAGAAVETKIETT